MDFLKNNVLFSFKYDGVDAREYLFTLHEKSESDMLFREYLFEDALKVTSKSRKISGFDAYEWVNCFENVSDDKTRVISELWDADITVPWTHEEPRGATPWQPDRSKHTIIHSTRGSTSGPSDFSDAEKIIFPNQSATYTSVGGRSSDGTAPYFNIHKEGKGIIVALGWTGQWRAYFELGTDSLKIRAKIEDTEFYVNPGESFRTLSVTVLNYEGTVADGQNLWRRLMKQEYSETLNRVGNLPVCTNFWGGLESAEIIDRVNKMKAAEIPFTFAWIDAGWGGAETLPTFDEFTGDWYSRVGDWRVSPIVHPNGMVDVSKAIHDAGYRFILWFESERARDNTPIVAEHPEYFLTDGGVNRLLNLGNPDAYAYIKDAIFGIIEKLGVDCYRQDFNFQPLPFWRSNDGENRRGMTEILHINALYRFFDEMLETFPTLIIDNCASGGRRLDLEMMKRSFPLWRSDAQCPANPTPETTQLNTVNFSNWLPYTGSGCGRLYDTYLCRSSYSAGMGSNFGFSKHDIFDDDPEKLAWLKDRIEELLRIRRFFEGDMYMLTPPTYDAVSWCATEWFIPETSEGMIQIFKREFSPYNVASFELKGIDADKTYVFEDIDGGSFEIEGRELCERGLSLAIEEKRVAKIFLFKAK